MKSLVYFTAVATLIIIISGCGPTDPVNKVIKTPMEMTWSVDTLAYPGSAQTLMNQICAFSAKDIYLVGWNSIVWGEMYHYDGTSWKNVRVENVGGHRINKIIGLAPNNIWGVGYEGEHNFIAHFDGHLWSKENISTKGYLLDVDGDSPNNIYACGMQSVVYHYNGLEWKYEKVTPNLPENLSIKYNSVAVYNGEVFLTGRTTDSNYEENLYFIKGKAGNWAIVDSMHFGIGGTKVKWGFDRFEKGNNGKLYSHGPNNLFIWKGNKWEPLPTPYYGLFGFFSHTDNYMLAVSHYIDYYNGQSWVTLQKLFDFTNDVTFYDAWTDGSEIFIVGNTNSGFPEKTILLHGK